VRYSLIRRPLHLQDGKQLQQDIDENMLRREELIKTEFKEENEAIPRKVQYFVFHLWGSVA